MNTLITYKDWEKLVLELGGELWETGKSLPESPIVFSTCDHVDMLFRKIIETQDYTNDFILVSGASDAGPCYQAEFPVWKDLDKWVQMDPGRCKEIEYHDYIVRSRHEKTRCIKTDKFSLKMYSWTSSTFPVIPKQIKTWYVTNCNIDEDRVVPIPFGVSPDSVDLIYKNLENRLNERSKRTVACWSNSTNERWSINKGLDKSYFLSDRCTPDIFFKQLTINSYCLCPEGNGLDSYRILESLYLGCLPIIVTNLDRPRWQRVYPDFIPICRPSEIGSCISSLLNNNTDENKHITLSNFSIPNSIYLEYWKERFQNELSLGT